ncbi:activator-dependent family glycosyltransferase [Streptomyces erythrochromogenes]|uniref:activator-dependent family glycosyltransferase n=1 Tax=Streptomyces erythrochromogenes TaxID=285574 RepID=UPI003691BFC0
MRVLFTTFGARNHVHAQVALAWALRAAGHEVCVASHPDLAEVIARTGLTAVPVGRELGEERLMEELREREDASRETYDEDAPDAQLLLAMDELRPEKLTYDHMHGVFTAMTSAVFQNYSSAEMIDDLVGFARGWRPDLVIWDPLTFAGAVAARVTGAAHARLMFGLDLVGRMRESYLAQVRQRPAALREDPVREWLGPVMERYGGEFTEDLVTGQWTVDPVPTSLRLPADLPYVPVRCVAYNGRGSVPDWLREEPRRPRVCLTLGVSHREVMGGDQASVGELIEAVAGLDVEVVATLDARQLREAGSLPPNVRAVDFVPMDVLLPTCSALVSHGGSGTVHAAFLYGVPQVLVPGTMWDNAIRADLVQRSGAGLRLDAQTLTAAALRDALTRVLTEPSFTAGAERLRRETLATPSPRDVVPLLESLTAEHRDDLVRNHV